jgi:hypothetical protein
MSLIPAKSIIKQKIYNAAFEKLMSMAVLKVTTANHWTSLFVLKRYLTPRKQKDL